MTNFNRSTRRRLLTLQQIPSVWEGDRRPLPAAHLLPDADGKGDCILWVDGSQGVVRAMDVVTPESGPEAIVRALMRAMEHPHSPGKPARPQRIVVRDREIQFFLRGVLQELDIAIDYVPELPLIDDLFRSFTDVVNSHTPELPPQFAEQLHSKAAVIWNLAPWECLEEQQILAIEINHFDVGTLYASVMGMLGMEYGVLFYRSQESLKRFRSAVLKDDENSERLEEAFLKQDCLFLTFDSADEDEDDDDFEEFADLSLEADDDVRPAFGTIHPLEGLRSVLYDEEAIVMHIALDALFRFVREHRRQLSGDDFVSLNRRYRITPPQGVEAPKQLNVTVSTLPELAAELEEMAGFDADDDDDEELFDFDNTRSLRDDLIPKDSFLSLGVVSWEMLEHLRQSVSHHSQSEAASEGITVAGDGLPVILIQTSRPKAKTVIDGIMAAGGLEAICFNPGADPFRGDRYDLGLLQTANEDLFLFGEFLDDDPIHIDARHKWNQRCQHTHGYCGLIIAKGLTGSARGNPQLRDMMALFEVRSLSPQDLGLGTLQLMPQFE